ncbi:hypothetical protein CYMTET_26232 [Cymbomonas tetramitiformis]|uniref:Sulfotransferase n=1 Tax=Cymbomonas tetramitiformis TaxID=36881 RepID=A0AAE0FSS0_9CHLO|nr:hypothetical protein CYMTET_26232 [Cymbomonas tetramitiformis]
MLRNSGCQEVANKVVVVAAQHGTGAAALTLLLQKLGVFMISGSRECAIHGGDPNQPKYRFPRGACVRLRSEHDSACQNRRMDFQVLKTESSLNCLKKMIHRTKDVCNKASTLSYPYSNVLYETVLREVKASLGHCVLRLKDCSYKKALSECPIALGWKSNLNLALLPVLAQLQAESKLSVTVLHLVRDGHDMVLGDMRDDLRNLYEVAESGALSEELEHVDFDTKMRFWSKLNTKVARCAARVLPKRAYIPLRIEDFVTKNGTRRSTRRATWLNASLSVAHEGTSVKQSTWGKHGLYHLAGTRSVCAYEGTSSDVESTWGTRRTTWLNSSLSVAHMRARHGDVGEHLGQT